jgi:hypothetical protein
VSVSVEQFSQEMLGEMLRRAIRVVKASIDLVSFSTGKGLILVLDKATLPNGKTGPIVFDAPGTAALCTAYTLDGLPAIMQIVLADADLWMALSDLVETITQPDRTQINCGRVVETIRTMVDANPNRKSAWKTLNERINLSDTYLRLITDQSTSHRHGDYVELGNDIGNAIRDRTWTAMNRFLEYRKRGNQPLPLSEFPLLVG